MGGGLSFLPAGGISPSSAAPGPSYASFLSGLGACQAATPQSITANYNAAQTAAPPPQQSQVDVNQLRQMLAGMMGNNRPVPPRDFGPGGAYTMANGLMGYNYRGGANRSSGGGNYGPGGGKR